MFENILNLDELRKAYRAAAMKAHPDHGGTDEDMQRVNAAYEIRFESLKKEHNAKAAADKTGKTRPINEMPDEFRQVIEKIINIPNISIELCGSWIWISGDTKNHKDAIKAAGCFWASQKKMWYWRSPADACHKSRGSCSMRDIRAKYGSETISSFGKADALPA